MNLRPLALVMAALWLGLAVLNNPENDNEREEVCGDRDRRGGDDGAGVPSGGPAQRRDWRLRASDGKFLPTVGDQNALPATHESQADKTNNNNQPDENAENKC